MHSLDATILLHLNSWVGTSWTFDFVLLHLIGSPLLKGGVLVALLWCAWERGGARQPAPEIVRTLAGTLVAVVLARGMQNLLPPRPRPLHTPELLESGFELAHNLPSELLREWSSFPSDHAVLFFAVAAAVFLGHRALGAVAFAWALIVTCMPRVYFGLHYPSDILAGAVLGIVVMAAMARLPIPERTGRTISHLAETHRGWFYALLFLLTYQIATLFADARELVKTVHDVVVFAASRL